MAQGGPCLYRMNGLDEVHHPSKSHPALDGIDFQCFSIVGNFILFLQVVEFVVNRAENDSAGIRKEVILTGQPSVQSSFQFEEIDCVLGSVGSSRSYKG